MKEESSLSLGVVSACLANCVCSKTLAISALLLLCHVGNTHAAARIVSLDYCADQYVLKFAKRASIAGISPEARAHYSYLAASAADLPVVRPTAEDVLVSKPDLVVRSYGGGPLLRTQLNRLNIPVVQIGQAKTLIEVQQTVKDVSAALGAQSAGEAIVAQMQQRLRALSKLPQDQQINALYMTSFGATSGPDTLIHDMLTAAGLTNFQQRPGWQTLPLERLIYESPDVVALAFFESQQVSSNVWSAARHPVARRQAQMAATVQLPGAWTSWGGWFVMDAIERLHAVAVAGVDVE